MQIRRPNPKKTKQPKPIGNTRSPHEKNPFDIRSVFPTGLGFCFFFDLAGVFAWVLSTMFGCFSFFFISPGVLMFLYIAIVGAFQTVGGMSRRIACVNCLSVFLSVYLDRESNREQWRVLTKKLMDGTHVYNQKGTTKTVVLSPLQNQLNSSGFATMSFKR